MKTFFPFIIILLSILWWYFWTSIWNQKNITNISSLENNITNIVEEVSPSIVSIIIKKDLTLYRSDPWGFFKIPVWSFERKIWWWTGFFITKDWIIITNKHVVSDFEANYIVITNSWKEYETKVIYIDPETDLALLKIDHEWPKEMPLATSSGWEVWETLEFISSEDDIKVWNFAIAIWNSMAEFQNSVSLGIVSGKNRNLWDIWLYNLIQTDASINPWNSWWPLINTAWNVIWINTLIINNFEKVWFAIPIDTKKINEILKKLPN